MPGYRSTSESISFRGSQKTTVKVVRPVIRAGRKVTLLDHGIECAEVVRLPKVDRKATLEALRAVGRCTRLPPCA